MRHSAPILVILLLLSAAAALRPARALAGPAEPITVSAAVSLKEALTDAATAYERDAGQKVTLNFGATGQLLAQIREGAPVDVFIAASDEQMDQAERQKLVDPGTRTVVARNRLVLIVPSDSILAVTSFADLAAADFKRLALGQPAVVPAGAYAMQVLDHLHLRDKLAGRLIYAASVRQVLDYVERGEVDAGIVYATDATQSGAKVRVVATADEAAHQPIRYVAAVTRSTKRADGAVRFVHFLTTDPAQRAFEARGFLTSAPTAPPEPSATLPIPTPQAASLNGGGASSPANSGSSTPSATSASAGSPASPAHQSTNSTAPAAR